MNKMLKGLLVAAMALSATHIQAHTSQTYLASRPSGMNLALESVTFNELTNEKNKDLYGADVQVSAFYSASRNSLDLGSYFGVNNSDTFTVNSVATSGQADGDLIIGQLVGPVGSFGVNLISLKPSQNCYASSSRSISTSPSNHEATSSARPATKTIPCRRARSGGHARSP